MKGGVVPPGIELGTQGFSELCLLTKTASHSVS